MNIPKVIVRWETIAKTLLVSAGVGGINALVALHTEGIHFSSMAQYIGLIKVRFISGAFSALLCYWMKSPIHKMEDVK